MERAPPGDKLNPWVRGAVHLGCKALAPNLRTLRAAQTPGGASYHHDPRSSRRNAITSLVRPRLPAFYRQSRLHRVGDIAAAITDPPI